MLFRSQNDCDKSKMFLIRQFSHGKSYRIIFNTFFVIGLLGAFVSFVRLKDSSTIDAAQKNEGTINIQSKRLDSLFNRFNSQEELMNQTKNEITILSSRIDSLKCSISKLAAKKKKNL